MQTNSGRLSVMNGNQHIPVHADLDEEKTYLTVARLEVGVAL